MDNELKDLLDFAKYDLMTSPDSAFISSIVFHLKFKWNTQISTAKTNGIDLEFNPKFFKLLSPKQRVFVLAHEGWHVALKHLNRFKAFSDSPQEAKLWNIAADYVINLMCHKAGMDTIQSPIIDENGVMIYEKSLLDSRFEGMSTDEVYMFLKQEREKQQQQQGSNGSQGSNGNNQGTGFKVPQKPDMDDLGHTPEGMSEAQLEEIIDDIIINAAVTAQMKGEYGTIPGNIQADIQKIIAPPLPWHVLFMRFMTSFAKNDYSYSRPNRRYLPDIVIPTLHSPSVEKIVFACDISASVSDEEFSLYLAKIEEARRIINPKETHIITFDTAVKDHYIYLPTDRITKFPFKGRGGTDPKCVLDYIDREKNKPTFLVFFSDMDFCSPENKPPYPVLWVGVNVWRKPHVNFGQYIEYDA